MAGLVFILPILAFDVWLFATTGRHQLREWIAEKRWRPLLIAATVGLGLATFLAFFVRFSYGPKLRVQGFPVPLVFFHLDDKGGWTQTELPPGLPYLGLITDFITGLVAPFIPCKIAEFIKTLKAELK
jgi:hypothetical protein